MKNRFFDVLERFHDKYMMTIVTFMMTIVIAIMVAHIVVAPKVDAHMQNKIDEARTIVSHRVEEMKDVALENIHFRQSGEDFFVFDNKGNEYLVTDQIALTALQHVGTESDSLADAEQPGSGLSDLVGVLVGSIVFIIAYAIRGKVLRRHKEALMMMTAAYNIAVIHGGYATPKTDEP